MRKIESKGTIPSGLDPFYDASIPEYTAEIPSDHFPRGRSDRFLFPNPVVEYMTSYQRRLTAIRLGESRIPSEPDTEGMSDLEKEMAHYVKGYLDWCEDAKERGITEVTTTDYERHLRQQAQTRAA